MGKSASNIWEKILFHIPKILFSKLIEELKVEFYFTCILKLNFTKDLITNEN